MVGKDGVRTEPGAAKAKARRNGFCCFALPRGLGMSLGAVTFIAAWYVMGG